MQHSSESSYAPYCYIKHVASNWTGHCHVTKAFPGHKNTSNEIWNASPSGKEGKTHDLQKDVHKNQIMTPQHIKGPFLSCHKPLFQIKAKCKVTDMKMKLILTRKVLHLAVFWRWEFLELGNGLEATLRRRVMQINKVKSTLTTPVRSQELALKLVVWGPFKWNLFSSTFTSDCFLFPYLIQICNFK